MSRTETIRERSRRPATRATCRGHGSVSRFRRRECRPQLPEIDAGSAIELPSRLGSQRTSHTVAAPEKPPLPRKSSRRKPSTSDVEEHFGPTLIAIPALRSARGPRPGSDPDRSSFLHPSDPQPGRLPLRAVSPAARSDRFRRLDEVESSSSDHRGARQFHVR